MAPSVAKLPEVESFNLHLARTAQSKIPVIGTSQHDPWSTRPTALPQIWQTQLGACGEVCAAGAGVVLTASPRLFNLVSARWVQSTNNLDTFLDRTVRHGSSLQAAYPWKSKTVVGEVLSLDRAGLPALFRVLHFWEQLEAFLFSCRCALCLKGYCTLLASSALQATDMNPLWTSPEASCIPEGFSLRFLDSYFLRLRPCSKPDRRGDNDASLFLLRGASVPPGPKGTVPGPAAMLLPLPITQLANRDPHHQSEGQAKCNCLRILSHRFQSLSDMAKGDMEKRVHYRRPLEDELLLRMPHYPSCQ